MDALISDLRESGALQRDGRRVSLEGVLTGAALGIFLVYMLEDLAAPAATQPLEGGAGSTGPARLPGSGVSPLATGAVPGTTDDGGDRRTSPGADDRPALAGAGENSGAESILGPVDALGESLSGRAGLLPGVSQPESLDLGQAAGFAGLSLSASGASSSGFIDSFGTGSGGGGGRGGAGGLSGDGALATAGWSGSAPGGAGAVLAPREVSDDFGAGGFSADGLLSTPVALATSGLTDQADASLGSAQDSLAAALQALQGGGIGAGLAGGGLGVPGEGGAPGAGSGGDGAGGFQPPPPPPKVLLVQVQSVIGADGLSGDGAADAVATVHQAGMENTVLDLRGSDADVLAVLSEGMVPVSAISQLDAASLEVITQQVAVLDSTAITGDSTSVVVISAQELLNLSLEAGTEATADVDSQVAALSGSALTALAADDLVELRAATGLRFEALGTPEQAAITVELLNQALNNSVALLGDGDNSVVIDSVIDGVVSLPQVDGLGGDLSLNAHAVGLDGSSLEAGAGDDVVLIRSWVDLALENLPEEDEVLGVEAQAGAVGAPGDLGAGEAGSGDPDAPVVLTLPLLVTTNTEAIALRDSHVDLGAGNDQLLLQGDNQNSSVDGGLGLDLLVLTPPDATDLEVLVDEANGFTVGSLEAASVEALVLGDGDDHVTLNQFGQLNGLLAGGEGADTIDFSSRVESVLVDLDAGLATDIGGGGSLSGFEAVIGSQANDQLYFSSDAASVDAGDGEDSLYLRWTPWTASGDSGVMIAGGTGRDLFVLAGLNEPVPADWDGVSGLPVFTDLEIFGLSTLPAAEESPFQGPVMPPSSAVLAPIALDQQVEISALLSSPSDPSVQEPRADGPDHVALPVSTSLAADQPLAPLTQSPLPTATEPLTSGIIESPNPASTSRSLGVGLSDRIALSHSVVNSYGLRSSSIVELTPSGLDGIGNARLLPIAPTSSLLSGISSAGSAIVAGSTMASVPQLAIGINSAQDATLYQIGGFRSMSQDFSADSEVRLRALASIQLSQVG